MGHPSDAWRARHSWRSLGAEGASRRSLEGGALLAKPGCEALLAMPGGRGALGRAWRPGAGDREGGLVLLKRLGGGSNTGGTWRARTPPAKHLGPPAVQSICKYDL